MIACPRCGQPCPPDAAICASCHFTLAPNGAAAQQQDYGGRATYGTHELSVRDLLSDDALPDWLREGGGGGGAAGYGQPPAMPAGPGYAAPQWGGQPPQPGYGGAPPGWGAPPAPQPGYGSGMPGWGQPDTGWGAPGVPGGPVAGSGAAQRLFDESALPDWLRQPGAPQRPALEAYPTLQQQQMPPGGYGAPAPIPPSYAAAPQPYAAGSPFARGEQAPSYQAPSSETSLSAQSLVDASALPGWLRGAPQTPQSPSANPNAAYRDASGMPGQSLVEESALPAWLRAEGPAASPSPSPSTVAGTPVAGQNGASIADWIAGSTANDALPPWLSQAYSAAQVGPSQVPARPAPVAWPAQPGQSPMAAPNAGAWGGDAAPAANGGFAASQLMDESALPDWLRAQGAALGSASPMNGGWPSAAQPGPAAIAPRPQLPPAPEAGQTPWGSPGVDSQPVVQRFSASELIDPDVLPSWARPGQEPSAAPPAPGRGPQSWIDEGGYPGDPWGDAGPRSARMPAVRRDDASADSRRGLRGGPLGADELPPWLQGTEQDGGESMGVDGASAARGYGGRGARQGPPSWPADGAQSPHDDYNGAYGEDQQYGDSEYASAVDDEGDEASWNGGQRNGRPSPRDGEQSRRGWRWRRGPRH